MATGSTQEQNARRVLDVYQHFESREGHVLKSNNFLAVGIDNRWNTKDLQSGLEAAIEKGWVEVTGSGLLKLTKSGFDEM